MLVLVDKFQQDWWEQQPVRQEEKRGDCFMDELMCNSRLTLLNYNHTLFVVM